MDVSCGTEWTHGKSKLQRSFAPNSTTTDNCYSQVYWFKVYRILNKIQVLIQLRLGTFQLEIVALYMYFGEGFRICNGQ